MGLGLPCVWHLSLVVQGGAGGRGVRGGADSGNWLPEGRFPRVSKAPDVRRRNKDMLKAPKHFQNKVTTYV